MQTGISPTIEDRVRAMEQRYNQLIAEQRMQEQERERLWAEVRQEGFNPETLVADIEAKQKAVAKFEAEAGPVLDRMEAELARLDNESHAAQPHGGFGA